MFTLKATCKYWQEMVIQRIITYDRYCDIDSMARISILQPECRLCAVKGTAARRGSPTDQ